MTHPEVLLAPYVDGTASSEERAAVDTHASTCDRCRAEIAAATSARAELKGLPVLAAPPGLIPDIPQTAQGPSRPDGVPGWYRWGGTAAVAAVIVLLLALVLPRLGTGTSKDNSRAAAPGQEATTQPSQVTVKFQDVDYRGDALRSALTAFAAADTAAGESAASQGDLFAPVADARKGTPAQAATARACIQEAFVSTSGTLVRLISARFEGAPAWVGVYAEGPGAGLPPDQLVARVAAKRTCTPLTLATVRLK